MRSLLLAAVTLIGIGAMVSCDEVAENPGDFSIKSTLEVMPQLTSIHGDVYDLEVVREIDTTYQYPYTVRDTVKDASGEPVIGPTGEYEITEVTKYYSSKTTARYVEMAPVVLPSKADTFQITLKSNARWKAPVPSAGGKVQWYFNYNVINGATTVSGGGDGTVDFRVARNKNYKRSVQAQQYILTADSTVMYKLVFVQKGEKDKN